MKICAFTIFTVRSSINSRKPVTLAAVHPWHAQLIDVKPKPELSQKETSISSTLFLKIAKTILWSAVGAILRSSPEILTLSRCLVRLSRLLCLFCPSSKTLTNMQSLWFVMVSSCPGGCLRTLALRKETDMFKLDHYRLAEARLVLCVCVCVWFSDADADWSTKKSCWMEDVKGGGVVLSSGSFSPFIESVHVHVH